MTKRLHRLLTAIFSRSFHVTNSFDAKTRAALDLAAESAREKHLARLAS